MSSITRRHLLQAGSGAGFLSALPLAAPLAHAQTRQETVRVLAEGAPNSRDPHGEGVSRESLGTFTNIYDRLINFDSVKLPSGIRRYDYGRFKGELAERFEVSDCGRVLTFHLRRDATFHDGAPVTAADVKWSLDRAVSLPASKRQLSTGSLTDPSQFTVVDAHTLRITLPRADRYTLPNLALTFASVLNAELVKKHATPQDPWGAQWVRNNAAGGGAYKVESWTPGQQIVYVRFDEWKSGPLPYVKRALFQTVPTPATRSAALQRGDADVALQLPPKDIDALSESKSVRVHSIPVTNSFRFIAFNTRSKPFDDVRVRQAVAWALPYTSLFRGASLGHGQPLFGAASATPSTSTFPQPYPYETQLQKARELLAQAGYANGFKTTFSYNVGDATIGEPAALLVQEALRRVGIEVTIEKVPGAQWGTLQTDRKLPFYIDSSSAWFNDPDYFFRIFFQGDWRWNFGAFDNAELGTLVEAARWETDKAKYDAAIRKAIQIVFREVPIVPLWLPSFDVALQPDLANFTYYIHGQVDFRPLTRG
ncbi:ABC transporter substrate-binding protein [Variovorax sp. Sphag1AA]|uniref:ABC transporter substrate-binding protein n=1 Tax=Variovorax sp. Sphag1AA TaxID=2587027 RepID=UPI00161295C0|nr:ABC transporter substrate-binding protein [Variovorax sp. Sphag1AA]MBB3181474.1 peptide/nickel transport system substrate-binding protein [Variovorax sp. Sphag1AA]